MLLPKRVSLGTIKLVMAIVVVIHCADHPFMASCSTHGNHECICNNLIVHKTRFGICNIEYMYNHMTIES